MSLAEYIQPLLSSNEFYGVFDGQNLMGNLQRCQSSPDWISNFGRSLP